MDPETQDPLKRLLQEIRQFREERDWRQFHSPKNLSMSIAIESGELMEHFQWRTIAESEQLAQHDQAFREDVGEELADVLMYCFHLADVMGLDIATIVQAKMQKNRVRFPIDKVYGKFGL